MEECDYCDDTFPDERRYLQHLESEHYNELGRIDRRRVDGPADDDTTPLSTYLLFGGLVVVVLAAMYFALTAGNSADGSDGPYAQGSVHDHGPIEVTIDGQTLDFSQPQYQYENTQNPHFHFEGGDGDQWHVHSQGVTLAYAMQTLGIEVTTNTVTFDGTTYDDSVDGERVVVEVNGESVTPGDYILQDEDTVRIVAESGN